MLKAYIDKEMTPEEKQEKETKAKAEYTHAFQLFRENKYEETKEILNELIKQYPVGSPDFYTLRCACYHKLGSLQEAIDDCLRAIEIPNGNTRTNRWNFIKLAKQSTTEQVKENCMTKVLHWLRDDRLWEEGWVYRIDQALHERTDVQKYIIARESTRKLIEVVDENDKNNVKPVDQERDHRFREVVLTVGKMNLQFWWEENIYFVLRGLTYQMPMERQVADGYRSIPSGPYTPNWSDLAFLRNFIRRSMELKAYSLPIFVILQANIFVKQEQEIVANRIIVTQALDILEEEYKSVTFPTAKALMEAVPQALTYYFAYHNLSNVRIFRAIHAFYRKLCPDLNYIAPYLTEKGIRKNSLENWVPGQRKIRIGFLSKFLHQAHSVYRDRSGIIMMMHERHNTEFDVQFFTFDPSESVAQELAKRVKQQILSRDIEIARKQLTDQNLDVLVFCEVGMDLVTYFLAYGRYAPVQINCWGHSDTSGQDHMDYFFSSKYYELPGTEGERNYSERLIRLDSLCTFYPDPLRWVVNTDWDTREKFGISSENNIYVCSQSIFKHHPSFDHVLYRILASDPFGVIMIVDAYGIKDQLIRARWGKTLGYMLGRIHFIGKQPLREYLNVMAMGDVMLDTYPFGGCNGSIEAFRLGKIVITCPGRMINGRFTTGFYHKMGIEEPIAKNLDEYIEKALYYGKNREAREALGHRIQESSRVLIEEMESVGTWVDAIKQCLHERQSLTI